MGFKCGIVGLPNVGKSTLFNALTKAGIEAANYPFCTIEPNLGIVPVPDNRLAELADIVQPQQIIAATMEFVDIAGLVAGASKGEGLGNQFLANIRETHAIAHVVRCFVNPDVVHVAGDVDPNRDIDIINTELMLADLETVAKALDKAIIKAKSNEKTALIEKNFLDELRTHLDQGKPARIFVTNEETSPILDRLHLLTAKPILYIANVDEQKFSDNIYVTQVAAVAKAEGARMVVICAAIEAEIVDLAEAEKMEFLGELGLQEPGLNRLIRTGYELLGLQTYFTAGPKEVRAWTIHIGTTAPKAAGVIHTDFEKGFIRAEVVSYDDYIKYHGETGAREMGKLRLEGKTYIVQNGDIMHFRFNV